MIEDVSVSELFFHISNARLPVLVDFYTASCGPCRQLIPSLQRIAAQYESRLHVIKVDVSDAIDLCRQYRIQSVPAVALFRGGVPLRWTYGFPPDPSIESMLVGNV